MKQNMNQSLYYLYKNKQKSFAVNSFSKFVTAM